MANKVFAVGQANVTTAASQLVIPKLPDGNKKGVLIKAHSSLDAAANTVPVFIGTNNQVTSSDGFSLGPGESVTIPISEDNVWAITTANTQVVSWMLV